MKLGGKIAQVRACICLVGALLTMLRGPSQAGKPTEFPARIEIAETLPSSFAAGETLRLNLRIYPEVDAPVLRVVLAATGALQGNLSGKDGSELREIRNVAGGKVVEGILTVAVMKGRGDRGTLELRVEMPEGPRSARARLPLNGFIAGDRLYFGPASLVELEQTYISHLEKSGAISAAESLRRRSALTTLRQ